MRHIGRIVMTMKNMAIIRFAGADTSTQPFHYLKLGADGGISGNSNVRGTVASSYKLFMAEYGWGHIALGDPGYSMTLFS